MGVGWLDPEDGTIKTTPDPVPDKCGGCDKDGNMITYNNGDECHEEDCDSTAEFYCQWCGDLTCNDHAAWPPPTIGPYGIMPAHPDYNKDDKKGGDPSV